MGKNDDIINLPHPVSKNHPKMSLDNRAAQFAPFAALVGYSEAITSSKEYQEDKVILAEDKKEEIEELLHHIQKGNKIEVKYYASNKKKYILYAGVIKKVDQIERAIIFDNRKTISIKDVDDIKLIHDETSN